MSTKGTIATVIIDLCFIVLIITVPITVLLLGFSNYGTINESLTFYYTPISSSPVEKLNLNVDAGNITMIYTNKPTNHYVKVEVNIELSGSNIAGKSYLDFFNIVWQNTSSPISFIIERKSDVLISLKRVDIIFILKVDIVFDINASATTGNIAISIPFAVTVGNIITNVATGDIKLNFTHCFIEGDITSSILRGNKYNSIELNVYNAEFNRNCLWTLTTETGGVYIEIYQYKDMGADATGTVFTNNGNIGLFYRDNTANVGALFKLLTTSVSFPYPDLVQEGFEQEIVDEEYLLTSRDYPAKNNYNMIFDIVTDGFINVDIC